MTAITISPDSPLHHLGRNFLQQFVNRIIPALSPPGELDDAAQKAHDQEALALLEDLKPRTRVEAAIAAQFLTAHYGSADCSRTAMECPKGSRDATRLHGAAGSLARVMFQALRMLQRLRAPERAPQRRHPMPSGNNDPAGASGDMMQQRHPMPSSDDRPGDAGDAVSERRHPMPSGSDDASNGGDDMQQRRHPMPSGSDDASSGGDDMQQRRPCPRTLVPGDPMPSSDDEPANAGDEVSEQRPCPLTLDPADPLPAGKAKRTWKEYAAAERRRPMSSGNGTAAGTGDMAAEDPMQSGNDDPSGLGDDTPQRRYPMPGRRAGQPMTLDVSRPDTGEPDRHERPIAYETMHRPDGTYWNEPPACWPGPSWLADRFPLSEKERLSLWGPKAWDELSRDMRLITWGYEHEPGVLEPAVLAALAAAGKNPGDYCSNPDLRRKREASPSSHD